MMPPNFPSLRSPPHTEEGVIETLREFHVNQETLPLLCYPHAMKNLSHHLASLSVTAWVGSLWAIGYLAVPVLFYAQPDRQLARFSGWADVCQGGLSRNDLRHLFAGVLLGAIGTRCITSGSFLGYCQYVDDYFDYSAWYPARHE